MKTKNPIATLINLGCLLFSLMTLFNIVHAQNVSFSPAITYDRTAAGTTTVATADVNGDGKVDLICANYGNRGSGKSVTVLTNNGSGVFSLAAMITVTNGSQFVLATDINGDGKPDLVISYQGSSLLTVLTNNGSGTFGLNSYLPVGTDAVWIATADINGDGKPDLITANIPGNTLTILTNNGSGSFGFHATLPTGNFPNEVVATDVNGDGKPDLISLNGNDGTISVFTNNGSGILSSNATYNGGDEPFFVAAADIKGDGKSDLILADYGTSTLLVLTNNGGGIFSSNATYNVGEGAGSVVVADINGDGKPDLISANDNYCPGSASCSDGSLTILTNAGNGTFSYAGSIVAGIWTADVLTTDVNHDGKQDVIALNIGGGYGPDTITELINTTVFPVPTLALKSPGKSRVVSWPASAISFTLQTNNVLGTTNWIAYQGPVYSDGFVNSVTNMPAAGSLFYRLKQ